MFTTPEQLVAVQKANMDAMFTVGQTMFAGVEKLLDLQLKAAKASFEDAAGTSAAALEVKDAQEAFAFTSSLAQPAAEKALAYSRHVAEIISATGAEFAKMGEAQVAANQKKVAEMIEALAKNAPAGSESAVALTKSAFAASTSAYDTLNKAAKQVTDAVQTNVTAATNATFKAADSFKTAAADATKAARGKKA